MAKQGERNTKYKFLIEALKLFANKGFEAVSVAEIAKAVGCSAPALYKHYGSKQELLEAIISESDRGFTSRMAEMKIDVEHNPELRKAVVNLTEEQEIDRLQGIVKYAIHDELSQAFRKLCAVEQFHMPRLAEIYTYRYTTFQFAQYEKIFEILMEEGKIKKSDPKTLAAMYMSLPIIAIEICDRQPEREDEIMDMLANHVREFNKNIRIG